MNTFFTNFYEYGESALFEYLGTVVHFIEENNPKYKKILSKRNEILNINPKLRDILENDISMELTKKDCEQLIEILNLRNDGEIELHKYIFFKGMCEAYQLLKTIGILNDENTK